jgi:hypothetical protein
VKSIHSSEQFRPEAAMADLLQSYTLDWGNAERIVGVEIHWPSGNNEQFAEISENARYFIAEGENTIKRIPLRQIPIQSKQTHPHLHY